MIWQVLALLLGQINSADRASLSVHAVSRPLWEFGAPVVPMEMTEPRTARRQVGLLLRVSRAHAESARAAAATGRSF